MEPANHLELSIIVPARDEEACLGDCLRSLAAQQGASYELIVVDDHSTDATRAIAESFSVRAIAESFSVRVIAADPLPVGWTGKCNAAWTGAKNAKGKWLLFTDADTQHTPDSIASGLREAQQCGAALLSYSPRQEVSGFWERALMPVIFAELAATYRPKDVCDPESSAAAANGQYLLIRRDVYDAIGGHAAVASAILEDVELAKRAKHAGYRLQFRWSDVVATRMYRSFPQMWEGWTKNLALLFPHPRKLAWLRLLQFASIFVPASIAVANLARGEWGTAIGTAVIAAEFAWLLIERVRSAHFDRLSNTLAIFGLPLFAILLLNSDISHKRGLVFWKDRRYGVGSGPSATPGSYQGTASVAPNAFKRESRP